MYIALSCLHECLELCAKDIDLEQRQIVIRRGKSQKGRPTVLPIATVEPLPRDLDSVKRHQADLARGFGRVLALALGRKYPNAATESGDGSLFGHSDVSSTMVYTHVLNRGPLGVRSPVDGL
jgi:hypothetical protein